MTGLLGSLLVKIAVDQEEFDKSLKSGESKFQAFSKGMTAKGKQLTAAVTLPILAIGTALVKVASDAEEVQNKFNTAFRGIEARAESSAKSLAEGYGLANSEAKSLLANTGDLLKGFGATADEALNTSLQVQQLAVDLASYNSASGATAESASMAITSALLGEREALKSLGVVVSEEAVKRQLAIDGASELTGELLLQAKAQATLKIVTAQSQDAIGDFERSEGSAVRTTKEIVSSFSDLAVEFGQELLPVAKQVLTFARDAIKGFSDLDQGTKSLIITVAGLAAGIGPVLTAIGSLNQAFTFLAANPIVAVVAGIAAITAGLLALNEARISGLQEEFGDIAESVGVAEDEMRNFLRVAELVRGEFNKIDDVTSDGVLSEEKLLEVSEGLKEWAGQLGLSKEQLLEIGLKAEEIPPLIRKQLEEMLLVEKTMREQTALADQQALARLAGAGEAENRAKLEEKRLERARLAAIEEQKILDRQKEQAEVLKNTYLEARQEVLSILESEKSEYDKIEEQINRLEDTKWASGQLEDDRLKAIQYLRDQQAQIIRDEEQARIDSEQRIAQEKLRQIELVDAADEAAWKDYIDREKERQEKQRELTNQIADSFQDFLGTLDSLGDALAEAEIQRVQESVAAQEITQEQGDKKIRKIKRKQAEDDKKLAIFNAVVDTSQAIIGFLANPGGYPGIALSVLAGVTGAAQIGAIAAQPLPALAEGGFFSGPALIGEAGREFAFPLDGPQGQNAMELMANQLSKAMSKTGNVSNSSTINFSSTFDLGNEATKRKAAREIFPFIIEEQKRRGVA